MNEEPGLEVDVVAAGLEGRSRLVPTRGGGEIWRQVELFYIPYDNNSSFILRLADLFSELWDIYYSQEDWVELFMLKIMLPFLSIIFFWTKRREPFCRRLETSI